jgi:hypothetical protein
MQTVKVKNKVSGDVVTFGIAHAENLLNLEKKVGLYNYVLEDEDFNFQDGHIVRIKRDSKPNQETKERSTNKKS